MRRQACTVYEGTVKTETLLLTLWLCRACLIFVRKDLKRAVKALEKN